MVIIVEKSKTPLKMLKGNENQMDNASQTEKRVQQSKP